MGTDLLEGVQGAKRVRRPLHSHQADCFDGVYA